MSGILDDLATRSKLKDQGIGNHKRRQEWNRACPENVDGVIDVKIG